jgi:hypothetical protein
VVPGVPAKSFPARRLMQTAGVHPGQKKLAKLKM